MTHPLIKLFKRTHHQALIKSTVNNLIDTGKLPPTAGSLTNPSPSPASFYMLPKVHKPNNPGRPIVSAHSCPTVYIAEYLDSIFQPIVQNLPSFVQDTARYGFLKTFVSTKILLIYFLPWMYVLCILVSHTMKDF